MVQAGLGRLIVDRATAGRSQAYKWLLDNRAEIAKAVSTRGSWLAIRDAAIEAGVKVSKRDQAGNVIEDDPSVAALRSAWLRVLADTAGTEEAKQWPRPRKKVAPTQPASSSPPPDHGRPSAAVTDPGEDPDDTPDFNSFVRERP